MVFFTTFIYDVFLDITCTNVRKKKVVIFKHQCRGSRYKEVMDAIQPPNLYNIVPHKSFFMVPMTRAFLFLRIHRQYFTSSRCSWKTGAVFGSTLLNYTMQLFRLLSRQFSDTFNELQVLRIKHIADWVSFSALTLKSYHSCSLLLIFNIQWYFINILLLSKMYLSHH